MKIRIIGSGCPTCKNLHEMVTKLKVDGKISEDSEIEYSNDINELIEMGVMGSPGLIVDDEVVKVGMPKDEKELLQLING